MNDADLDQSYSAVCEALAQVGEARAPLFLAMLCLSMVSRFERADQVLPLVANALAQCDEGGLDGR
jgi:hypothetical protein